MYHPPSLDINLAGYSCIPDERDLSSTQPAHHSYIPCVGLTDKNHHDLECSSYYPYTTYESRGGDKHNVYPNPSQWSEIGISQEQRAYPQFQQWDSASTNDFGSQSAYHTGNPNPPMALGQSLNLATSLSESVPVPIHPTSPVMPSALQPTMAQASKSISRRRYTPERWTEVRPTIQALYIDNGFSLSKTKKIMDEQYDFKPSCVA